MAWTSAKVIENHAWTARLFSLRFNARIEPFVAGQFVRVGLDIDGERIGRPYSLVNAPKMQPHEIYFSVVPEGPLSPRLARLQPGDTFFVNDRANGFFTIGELAERRDLWLIATGTAIGPYLSMLRTAEPWMRFENAVLVHAVRTAEELTYADVVTSLRRDFPKRLRYVPMCSRESVPDALFGRIPGNIESGALEDKAGLQLAPGLSQVMLCGNAGMIEDVSRVLMARGMKKNRRREPGHITTEKYH